VKPQAFRVARPTDRLDAVREFYIRGLGLVELGSFENHAGYDGCMVGVPGTDYHLEFTSHEKGSPCPAPTRDNLLVFYLENATAVERIRTRMEAQGHVPVEPENPYWVGRSVTFEDPDGWRVVVVDNTAA
jgi:catechol 2,3-dioxygenase-like lactoylglutathione lyase family enzyme